MKTEELRLTCAEQKKADMRLKHFLNEANSQKSKKANKVSIDGNQFCQVQGVCIFIEGKDIYTQFLLRIKDNKISNCGTESKLYSVPNPSKYEIKAEARAIKNAKCPPPQACVLLQDLHCLQIKLQSNTIQQSSGAGMKLYNVRCAKVIPEAKLRKVPTDFNEANNFF